jgi:flagellar hook-basal body complex protein FliE
MSRVSSGISGEQILAQLRDMQAQMQNSATKSAADEGAKSGPSFIDYLKDGVKEVNMMQQHSDKMGVDIASGKSENLHEAMLAASKAELSFNLMVQVRNKILDAYQEVMRMQV